MLTAPVADLQLDRRSALPAIVGDHERLLIVSSLGGPSRDMVALTGGAPHLFMLGGAMGASVPIGLGLALARPDRRVLVVAGDGELLMSLGALATAALAAPRNLAILCLDNGSYGETGRQESHSARVVDLEGVARASGIATTLTVREHDELDPARDLLQVAPGPVFVDLRVSDGDPTEGPVDWNPAAGRLRFLGGAR